MFGVSSGRKRELMRTIEVKDGDGNVIAGAELEDNLNIARLLHRLDKRRQQRSVLGLTLRDHIVASRSGGNIYCKCGFVAANAAQWAAHVAHILVPAAT